MDPVATIHDLGPWVAHAYAAGDPGAGSTAAHPGGFGFAPGVLDWEDYLGALEEIGYRGFLTVWPDPAGDPAPSSRRSSAASAGSPEPVRTTASRRDGRLGRRPPRSGDALNARLRHG